MIFIGERINGLQPRVRKHMLARNREAIQQMAVLQAEGGASYLDLNVGTAWLKPAEVMVWLVQAVQEAVSIPLAVDSRRVDVVEAGLAACRGPAMINSTTGEKEKLAAFMELAVKYGAALVGLTIDEQGIPPHAVGRVAVAKRILDFADNYGLPHDRVFIDPVLLPLKFSPSQGPVILDTIRTIRREREAPHIIVGLSNCSQGTKNRKLINRTFLAMAISCGLDAAIADVLDSRLLEIGHAAEVILERRPYSDQAFVEMKKAVGQK